MTDQSQRHQTVSSDPTLAALVVAAAQLARAADPCCQSDDDGDRPAFVVSAADMRRLRRALTNLSRNGGIR